MGKIAKMVSTEFLKQLLKSKPKTYDKTETIRKVLKDPTITKATLYVDYSTVLQVKFAGHKKPKPQSPKSAVKDWLNGYAWARRKVSLFGITEWFLVKYPAKLVIEREKNNLVPGLNKVTDTLSNMLIRGDLKTKIIMGLSFIVIIYLISKKISGR